MSSLTPAPDSPEVVAPATRAVSPLILVLAALLLPTVSASCGSKAPSAAKCNEKVVCPNDQICMYGTCLPRGMDRTVAVEILPRTDSPAARTGIANVALGPGQIALAADDRVLVQGTVTNAPNAHVVMWVANSIPGEADLQFETELADFKFQIGVGKRLIRAPTTIWLIPNVGDQLQPPVPFTTMLDATLNFTFPTLAEMTVVRGVLHDSLDLPPGRFLARALLNNKVISNVAATDVSGGYQLLVAPGAVPANSDPLVTIDFTPALAESGPRFQTTPFLLSSATSINGRPRVFKMPPSLAPTPVRFMVQSSDKGALPLGDVTMRFRTEITAANDGVAIHEREARTDARGVAQAALIPGTDEEPRHYEITIIPPPDSPYATKCVAQQAVTLVGSNEPTQYLETFSLDPKVTLQGTVLASDQSPAATVSVTVTQLAVSSECPNAVSTSPVSSTSLRTGAYQMLVDPGTYRLEIDPPAGSPMPRLTEEGNAAVVVTGDPVTTHNITLPPGEVIEGDVKDVNSMPLGGASLRIYKVLCHGDSCVGPTRIPPALQAQTRTDMVGHFRAVLPSY